MGFCVAATAMAMAMALVVYSIQFSILVVQYCFEYCSTFYYSMEKYHSISTKQYPKAPFGLKVQENHMCSARRIRCHFRGLPGPSWGPFWPRTPIPKGGGRGGLLYSMCIQYSSSGVPEIDFSFRNTGVPIISSPHGPLADYIMSWRYCTISNCQKDLLEASESIKN